MAMPRFQRTVPSEEFWRVRVKAQPLANLLLDAINDYITTHKVDIATAWMAIDMVQYRLRCLLQDISEEDQ